tara:strand:+ start:335 stop:943 length:609 start_codon:yes stop_codon:yes gene_type:complete
MISFPKFDLYKSLKSEYAAKAAPKLITPTSGQYLGIEGRGRPGDATFGDHVAALYAVAYTTKMRSKVHDDQDYAVGKLETIWLELPAQRESYAWHWQLLIRTPDFVSPVAVNTAIQVLLDKKKSPRVQQVSLHSLDEGPCVQILHVGPYEDEPQSFAIMQEFAATEGFSEFGRPHEIYLSDPRRVEPAKLKTILRLPVSRGT